MSREDGGQRDAEAKSGGGEKKRGTGGLGGVSLRRGTPVLLNHSQSFGRYLFRFKYIFFSVLECCCKQNVYYFVDTY